MTPTSPDARRRVVHGDMNVFCLWPQDNDDLVGAFQADVIVGADFCALSKKKCVGVRVFILVGLLFALLVAHNSQRETKAHCTITVLNP